MKLGRLGNGSLAFVTGQDKEGRTGERKICDHLEEAPCHCRWSQAVLHD